MDQKWLWSSTRGGADGPTALEEEHRARMAARSASAQRPPEALQGDWAWGWKGGRANQRARLAAPLGGTNDAMFPTSQGGDRQQRVQMKQLSEAGFRSMLAGQSTAKTDRRWS